MSDSFTEACNKRDKVLRTRVKRLGQMLGEIIAPKLAKTSCIMSSDYVKALSSYAANPIATSSIALRK